MCVCVTLKEHIQHVHVCVYVCNALVMFIGNMKLHVRCVLEPGVIAVQA